MRVSVRKLPWIEIGILLIALILRVALLDIKPPHFDEGVNGWFADKTTSDGFFRYDPTNYHGPLHMYAVFLSQTLFGRNVWALRLPAIAASLLAVWALLRYREFFGPTAARIAALAMAVSPACVFYGRYSIHESGMMLFQIVFLWGLLGIWQKGERRFLFAIALGGIGMMLTKETYVIHLASFALAGLVLFLWELLLKSRNEPEVDLKPRNLAGAVAAGLGVPLFVFFFVGLLTSDPHPRLYNELLSRFANKEISQPLLAFYFEMGFLTAALAAFWVFATPRIPDPRNAMAKWSLADRAWTLGISTVVIVFFYSGNFLAWPTLNGVHDTFLAWFNTGVESAGHAKTTFDIEKIKLGGLEIELPGSKGETKNAMKLNYYWVHLMAVYEWPALAGLLACLRYILPSDARLRYIAIYAGGVLLAFSLIPYKTPWCILSIIWPFFLLLGGLVQEISKRFPAPGRIDAVGAASGAAVVLTSIIPCLQLNFEKFDDPKQPYVYVQTFRESRLLTDPLLGMAKRDPKYYHVKGRLFLDSYYPLPWVFGDFTQLGYYKPSDISQETLVSDFIVADKKDETKVETMLAGDYFKRPFRLRDAQGDCVVYFRAPTYGDWFKGEVPTHYPTQSSVSPAEPPSVP